MRQKELKEALAEKEYWDELANAVGWRLHGWTYRSSATFRTAGIPHSNPIVNALSPIRSSGYEFIEMTGEQRDAIMTAINRGKPCS